MLNFSVYFLLDSFKFCFLMESSNWPVSMWFFIVRVPFCLKMIRLDFSISFEKINSESSCFGEISFNFNNLLILLSDWIGGWWNFEWFYENVEKCCWEFCLAFVLLKINYNEVKITKMNITKKTWKLLMTVRKEINKEKKSSYSITKRIWRSNNLKLMITFFCISLRVAWLYLSKITFRICQILRKKIKSLICIHY